jgi:hypothetical protein
MKNLILSTPSTNLGQNYRLRRQAAQEKLSILHQTFYQVNCLTAVNREVVSVSAQKRVISSTFHQVCTSHLQLIIKDPPRIKIWDSLIYFPKLNLFSTRMTAVKSCQ